MKRILTTSTVLLAATLVVSQSWAGSDRKIGAAGAQEMRIPVGTRGIALGGATAAAQHGLESLYYNPAGIAGSQGVEAMFSNSSYLLPDTDVRYFALSSEQSWGTIGVSAKILDLGELEVTTEQAPEGTGRIDDITFTVLGLSAARYLTDTVSFGLTGYFINETILDVSAKGVAVDMGLRYDVPWRNSSFGIVIKNFGPEMSFDGAGLGHSVQIPGSSPNSRPRGLRTQSATFELPSYFQLGGVVQAYESGDNTVIGYGSFQSHTFSQDEMRGGLEYLYQDIFMLRAGYTYADQNEYVWGPSAGFGVNLPVGGGSLAVDYAYQGVDTYFDDLHTFSARFQF